MDSSVFFEVPRGYSPLAPLNPPLGVGACTVLSHKPEDSTEHPVAFASRSLSTADKTYTQLDKKAIAIMFGVKHFHQYLCWVDTS